MVYTDNLYMCFKSYSNINYVQNIILIKKLLADNMLLDSDAVDSLGMMLLKCINKNFSVLMN